MNKIQIQETINELNYALTKHFNFVIERIKNFTNLDLEEQLSYSAIGIGTIMLLLALIFWILL